MTDYKDLMRAFTATARWKEREAIAKGLRVIKAMEKAGKPVKAATIDGVELQFGAPESAPKTAPDNEVEAWIARQRAH
jgi:hypothetical protein